MLNFFSFTIFAGIIQVNSIEVYAAGTQVGETCNGNAYFTTTSFLVSPWPPERGKSIQFNMTGTYTLGGKVNQLSIMNNFDHTSWNFIYEPIEKIYNVGDTVSYVYTIPVGNVTGRYFEQLTLEKFDPNHQYVSCWQFSYIIF